MSTTPDILTPRDSTTTGVFADAAGSAAMRGAMARLCRAVSSRMMPDEPTPEDRLELMEAYAAACALLESCQPNAEVSEGGTRDSRIETAAQSRPSLH